MNSLIIEINEIQNIQYLKFEIDLTKTGAICLTGKNGIGKTTLLKIIGLLKDTSFFNTYSSKYALKKTSSVLFTIDDVQYKFKTINTPEDGYVLQTDSIIPHEIQSRISIELPIPNGSRFKIYNSLAQTDSNLRDTIQTKKEGTPKELIHMLNNIYQDQRFNGLKSYKHHSNEYYYLPLDNNFYIREDYFSSGEFFIINLYREIKKGCQFIVIDEIDISLDSATQIKIIKELNKLSNGSKVLFTTHSLPIMEMMDSERLFLFENDEVNQETTIQLRPTTYIKSTLFQYSGFDYCFLTEDDMLEKYIQFVLDKEDIKYNYKVIYTGGSSNVVDLLRRAKKEDLFGVKLNIRAVLDGDQKTKYGDKEDVILLPFESIEKHFYTLNKEGKLKPKFKKLKSPTQSNTHSKNAKTLYKNFKSTYGQSDKAAFGILERLEKGNVEKFKKDLLNVFN